MKHLLLAALLCFCGIFHGYAADDGITLTFTNELDVTVTEDLKPPKTLPPTRPGIYSPQTLSSNNLVATTVQIMVYDKQGVLVYQSIELVSPNSKVSIDTTNWHKGEYTLVVCFPQGDEKTTKFTL